MELNSIPRLSFCSDTETTESVLLIPEGTLNLTGPTREILRMLDGKRNVTDVVTDLLQQFEGADAVEVQRDVLGLLDRLQQRGVVRT